MPATQSTTPRPPSTHTRTQLALEGGARPTVHGEVHHDPAGGEITLLTIAAADELPGRSHTVQVTLTGARAAVDRLVLDLRAVLSSLPPEATP